jgi:predicted SprT family Zn-dependent metalloprotease
MITNLPAIARRSRCPSIQSSSGACTFQSQDANNCGFGLVSMCSRDYRSWFEKRAGSAVAICSSLKSLDLLRAPSLNSDGYFKSGVTIVANRQSNYAQALSKWARLWRTPGLPRRVSISFSRRLKRSLGRTRPESGIITLNAGLASVPRPFLLQVLCHETAHIAVRLLHGYPTKPHGPEWRALVRAAGYSPSTSLRSRWLTQPSRERTASRNQQYRCPVCQTNYLVRRRNAHLHCRTCLRVGVITPLRLIQKR